MIMVSRIYVPKKAMFENVKMKEIKEQIGLYFDDKIAGLIAEGKTPRLALQKKLEQEMIDLVEYVIIPQLENSFRLDLNDKLLAEKLGISERRAKTVRLELKAAEITWFPEWSRPKKKGQYPWWMLQKHFIIFKNLNEDVEQPKKAPKKQKYQPLYYQYLAEAKAETYASLEEWDMIVSVKEYMIMVYETLNQNLERDKLRKEMLLK